MVQAGKTIVRERGRPESDSERERVRKLYRNKKIASVVVVVLIGASLLGLSVKAIREWIKWLSNREEVFVVQKEPSVEVIDERTGQTTTQISSRMKEYIANLEEEFAQLGYKVVRARIPVDKIREIDVEIEGVSGLIKVHVDRNPAVSAEDGVKMIKYLEGQGITEFEYIDVRVERKAFWK